MKVEFLLLLRQFNLMIIKFNDLNLMIIRCVSWITFQTDVDFWLIVGKRRAQEHVCIIDLIVGESW